MIKQVKKLWGHEEWLVNTNRYCAKFLNLNKGFQCSLHYHKLKDETFYVLKGIVLLTLNDVVYTLKKGMSVRVEPKDVHRFTALSNKAIILEVSTTHFDTDSYRIEESCKL